jgi:hypothetical protein
MARKPIDFGLSFVPLCETHTPQPDTCLYSAQSSMHEAEVQASLIITAKSRHSRNTNNRDLAVRAAVFMSVRLKVTTFQLNRKIRNVAVLHRGEPRMMASAATHNTADGSQRSDDHQHRPPTAARHSPFGHRVRQIDCRARAAPRRRQ